MKNKVIILLLMVISLGFLYPMVAAESVSETISSILGVDLTTALVSGGSSALFSLSGIVAIYRIVKKPVNETLKDSKGVLEALKKNYDQVISGEKTIQDAVDDSKKIFLNYQASINEMVSELKQQNGALKNEIIALQEGFNTLKETFLTIKNTNIDILEILRLGFGNIEELVVNGIANKINKVGEAADESEF